MDIRAYKRGLVSLVTGSCVIVWLYRLYDMQGDGDEEAEKVPSVAERIRQMESKKIRFSAMRDKAAKRRYLFKPNNAVQINEFYT